MEQHPLIFCIPIFLLLIQTHSLTPPIAPSQPPNPSPSSPSSSSSSSSSSTTLDPKQIRALQSLNIPTKKDPCSSNKAIKCDTSTPFRHLLSLRLSECSSDVSLSTTALESLSTLNELQFINCSVSPVNLPSELASNLKSFTSINSFKKLSGVWLSHLENLTDLTVTDVPIKASGPVIIVAHMKHLTHVTISHANLSGELPGKSWGPDVSHIDLSNNLIKGKIPTSMTRLDKLISLNLSNNQLVGEIPTSIGDLIDLKNLSLSSNSLSGSIPGSLASTSLTTLDLGSNQLNGTIPKFIAEMKSLKYLNLEKNNFHGVMPFNASFIKKLVVFKIGDNANLCYNHTSISSKLKLGIAKCDKNGFPVLAPAMSPSEEGDLEDESSSEDSTSDKNGGHHGPNKVVLGIAIALSSIVFLIIFLILLSRKCA